MFLSESDQLISDEYLSRGYIIRPVSDLVALEWMRNKYFCLASKILNIELSEDSEAFLNQIHLKVPLKNLNSFRLQIIREFNALKECRRMYFNIARPYLESLVGNELAMQSRINLSIQFPGDTSSLLPIHADTWSGDSPYEVVVWLPLVNCYSTKTMYILPPNRANKLSNNFSKMAGESSESLFQRIEHEVEWLTVKFGEVLIFNQSLPHGNRVNRETETRWSMNCRFKGVFSPYGDKKVGEFFEPITVRAASRVGMNYHLPEVK